MAQLIRCVAIAAFITLTSAHPSPQKSKFKWSEIKHLIAFGDSYTYVQGTQGRQNYSFIGDNFNFSFSPSDLLSNRIVQNQTATAEGGPNWVEYLTDCGLKPGLTDPRSCNVQLWDFAFAGADISDEYTPLHHNYTVSLVQQVKQFDLYAQPVLKDIVDARKSLVAFWIGINDINDSDKYDVDFPSFYNQLISTLFESVAKVYGLGYKNFLFMNLPPLDRNPSNVIRKPGPLPNATMIEWYDDALLNLSQEFSNLHNDAKIMNFDVTTYLNGVLNEHEKYGIKNVTNFCAGYDQPYINVDPARYGCAPLNEYL